MTILKNWKMLSSNLYILLFATTLYSATMCVGDIAKELEDRYNALGECTEQAGGKSHQVPFYMCHGLFVRHVREIGKTVDNAWSFRKHNIKSKSFSTVFMHNTVPVKLLAQFFTSGFVIFPPSKTPTHKYRVKALCAFPMDAKTDERETNHACTGSNDDSYDEAPTKSGFCRPQGITDLAKWTAHTNTINSIKNPHYVWECQCAFDMSVPDAYRDFQLAIAVNKHLHEVNKHGFSIYTEVLIEMWDESVPVAELPIEAFVYYDPGPSGKDKDTGKNEALLHQYMYYGVTGIIVPVVRIQTPTDTSAINFKLEPILSMILEKEKEKKKGK